MVQVEAVLKKDAKERRGTLAGDFWGFPSVLVPLNRLREAKIKKSDERLGSCSYRGLLAG